MDQPETTTPETTTSETAATTATAVDQKPLEGLDALDVPLQSSDGKVLTISALATRQSGTLSNIVEECGTIELLEERQEKIIALELARSNGASADEINKLEAAVPALDSLAIPMPEIDANDLQIVISYMEHFRDRVNAVEPGSGDNDNNAPVDVPQPACVGAKPPPIMDEYEKMFVEMRDVDAPNGIERERAVNARLFNILYAANYLTVQKLLDICAYTIATRLKGKTPDQIRQEFSIVDDFTEDERKKMAAENEWIAE